MVYFLTRTYVKIALWFFYQELKVRGLENIPKNKPIILTPNHQNSFIDAIIIACIVPQPIYYLVRASVFRSKIARWLLGLLNMMPIYRFRDGLKEVKKNDAIIDSCTRLLQKNKWLMVFPEGNHDMNYAIRPLQKGIGRIAFKTIEQHNADVQIVPVGIYYENHTASRSRVLVNIGEPINVNDHYKTYKEDSNQGFRNLINQVSLAMEKLTIHIAPIEKYNDIYAQWRLKQNIESNIIDQYNADLKILTQIESNTTTDISINQNKSITYKKSRLILFPLFVYGVINHLFAYKILNWIIREKVTDIHFYSSIKLALGMVLVPLFYGMQSFGLYQLGVDPYWILLYIFTLPITGMIAHRYRALSKY